MGILPGGRLASAGREGGMAEPPAPASSVERPPPHPGLPSAIRPSLFQRRVCNVPQRSDARPHEFQLVVIAVDDVFAIQL